MVGNCTVKYQIPVAAPPRLPISNFTAAISFGFMGARWINAPETGSITPTARMVTARSAGPVTTGFAVVVPPLVEVVGLVVVVAPVPDPDAITFSVAVPCGRAVDEVALGMKTTETGTSIVDVPESIGV